MSSDTTNKDTVSTTPTDNISRKDLVDTAIRFLQNPKVVPTPLENKRLFLAKKGLTESEIELALKSSGAYNVSSESAQQPAQQQIQNNSQVPALVNNISPKQSIIYKVIKWISNFILAGCIAYTAYKLVVKRFFLKSKLEPSKDSLVNENNQLKQTIQEMRETLDGLKQSVDNVTNIVRQFHISKPLTNSPNSAESDLKSEVQSIKSLLLSRSQFPAVPTMQPVSLPTWQLESKIMKAQVNLSENELTNETKTHDKFNDLTMNDSTTSDGTLNKSLKDETVEVDND